MQFPDDRRGGKQFPIFTPMSGSVRQQKFSKLIQKELSDIFQRDQRGLLGNEFVTIMDAQVSPDLSIVRVYISMALVKDKKALLEKLELHKKEIRKALGERIRNQAPIVPQINFFLDETEEGAQRIEDLIKSLNIPPAPPGD
ncbi:MAG: ribosome-binding factor A [Bacteroidota bacterium]